VRIFGMGLAEDQVSLGVHDHRGMRAMARERYTQTTRIGGKAGASR
jgi:hypothetical protein